MLCVFLPVAYLARLHRRSCPKIRIMDGWFLHRDGQDNHSRLLRAPLCLARRLSNMVMLQLRSFLPRYASLQYNDHLIPFRQLSAHQSDAYQVHAYWPHVPWRRLPELGFLRFRLAPNAHGILRFLLLIHHRSKLQKLVLIY